MFTLMKAGQVKKVFFRFFARPGSQVSVAGTFNNWNPKANPLMANPDSGHFKTAFRVTPGIHEYKFIVNGVWTIDPNSSDRVVNGYGTINSVLRV